MVRVLLLLCLLFCSEAWAAYEPFQKYGLFEKGKALEVRLIKAQASDVPLFMACTLILPKGWQANLGDEKNKKVSFQALGEPWTAVLDRLGKESRLSLELDWKKMELNVVKAPKRNFGLVPGLLSKQLRDWCAQDNFSLVWKVDRDFLITREVDFGSDFLQALEGLGEKLTYVGYPLSLTVYVLNNVLEVRGK